MSIIVRPVEPTSREWERLAATSHQTSIFVSPSWLAEDRPVVIGAFDGGNLTTGLVARDLSEFPTPAPYQGLILSAATRPAAVAALIDWVSGIGGQPTVWCAPSLIDVRPFQTRERPWRTEIRYTFFASGDPVAAHPEPVAKTAERFSSLGATGKVRVCLSTDCVKFYEDEKGLVAWGQDPQDRGYLLGFAGDFVPLAKTLIGTCKDADLGGTWGWAKSMHPKLRTSYGLILES